MVMSDVLRLMRLFRSVRTQIAVFSLSDPMVAYVHDSFRHTDAIRLFLIPIAIMNIQHRHSYSPRRKPQNFDGLLSLVVFVFFF